MSDNGADATCSCHADTTRYVCIMQETCTAIDLWDNFETGLLHYTQVCTIVNLSQEVVCNV